MLVEPTQGRASIEDEGSRLRIAIPSKFNLFVVLFLLFWLGGWTMGEVSVIRDLFSGRAPAAGLAFMGFWLCGWTLGGIFAFLTVLWMCFGKEILEVDSSLLSCGKTIFSIGFPKQYRMADIRNLRVNSYSGYFGSYSSTYIRPSIAFDYGAKTVRLGYGIDEAEAGQIVKRLQERFSLKA